ncbi:alpha/beta fold hydrolase [Actinokineospora terrae]|uniref:Pimeloyl-ACP methyl ester carboxylesterase n=1 Tax=Actinokineospora terrae TaxID=155974 RepID=A0A1H9VCT4_9PSEU|nr:alpha/beta hydrolase [Actinokineospora terrae]SES19027.1 Pimeloyl-ACP methyl ester carboxylesterase [Actinokineospora terrae]
MPAIEVPGATLHYQVSGAGPTLLLIPGGGGDADTVSGLATRLADRFAVISYDRRGLSRSALADPDEHPSISTHADDAARVIAAVGAPAAVFGSSLGAIIALDLLVRHPDPVRLVVAHEPPLSQVLTGEGQRQARAVQAMLEQPGPQWRDVALALAIDHSTTEPGVEIPRPTEREFANQRFFHTRDAPTAHRYHLDVDALRPNASRLILAGGTTSAHAFPHHCALALADALSVPFVEFPGDHVGLVTQPTTFAARLAELLA